MSANTPSSNLSAQSHTGAIAGGVIGGLILLSLIIFGVLIFLRRRKKHTAPSAEFLTVYPPQTPFARAATTGSAASFRSDFSIDPPASYTTEKYNSYPQHMMNYP